MEPPVVLSTVVSASTMAVAYVNAASTLKCMTDTFLLCSAGPPASIPCESGIIGRLFEMKRDKGTASELFLESGPVLAQFGFIEVLAADLVGVEGHFVRDIAAVGHWCRGGGDWCGSGGNWCRIGGVVGLGVGIIGGIGGVGAVVDLEDALL